MHLSQSPFRFQALLNVRRAQLDLRRQTLSQLGCEEQNLIGALRNLQGERMEVLDGLRARGKVGRVDLAASRSGYQHARILQQRLEQLQRRINLVRAQSNLCRQGVLELSCKFRLLEKLQQTQRDQRRAAESRRERLFVQERLAADAYPRSSP